MSSQLMNETLFKCVLILVVLSLATIGYSEEQCFGDDDFSWPQLSQRSGLDVSCLAYAGTLPLDKYEVVDVRTNASVSLSLGPVKGARQLTVPELKYRSELKDASLLLVDEGFDTSLMNYYCHTLKQSGFTDVKIAVGGIVALLQAQPSFLAQSDISELVYLIPRQAYSILDVHRGRVVAFDGSSDTSKLPANTVFIKRADVIAELTKLQSHVAKIAEWQPVLLVGSEADYQFYFSQRKKPLTGVYLLRGGLSAYESYKQERYNILARKELNKVPPCQRR
jgi:hypothetical protein